MNKLVFVKTSVKGDNIDVVLQTYDKDLVKHNRYYLTVNQKELTSTFYSPIYGGCTNEVYYYPCNNPDYMDKYMHNTKLRSMKIKIYKKLIYNQFFPDKFLEDNSITTYEQEYDDVEPILDIWNIIIEEIVNKVHEW